MTYEEIFNQIKQSKSICIISHIDPDADAIASMVVLKDFLINHFNIPYVDLFAETNNVQENCKMLLGNNTINNQQKIYDCSIMLDAPNLDRLGIYKNLFISTNLKVCIDHHNTNLNCGDLNIVEDITSTCEIVYKILKTHNYNFTKENLECIYAGIITDTNNLTTPNIKNSTFEIISQFIEKIDFISVYNNFFANFSLNNIKLLSIAIKNIKNSKNNNKIVTFISKNQFKKYKFTPNDTIGIINRLATISNNKLTCFIYPKNEHYYVSLRAKNSYNVAEIAKRYGGGGHIGASGFLSKLSIKKIIKLINLEFSNLIKD